MLPNLTSSCQPNVAYRTIVSNGVAGSLKCGNAVSQARPFRLRSINPHIMGKFRGDGAPTGAGANTERLVESGYG